MPVSEPAGAAAGAGAGSGPGAAAGAATIVVVGLGPAGPEHLTTGALRWIDESEAVFLRTSRHPSAEAVLARRADTESFDVLYETIERFEDVYESIVSRLLEAAAGAVSTAGKASTVCYAVPGSPTVAERSVELLRARAAETSVSLRVEPAVSYVELAWDRLGIDPAATRVCFADASGFSVEAATATGPLLVSQAWSRQLLSDMKLALEEPPADQRAVLLHHLGLPDEQVVDLAWSELDRTLEPDHLTSVFVPGLVRPPAAELAAFAETVALLRERCPWDREQTHQSLVRHLLEETYEAIEALEGLGDDPSTATAEAVAHAEEELGDLLCQVVFHATIGAEEGLFTLSDVARSIDQKLITRHPHVFSDAHAETAEEVLEGWERAKDRAKRRTHLLEGIPAAMPALARADKVERKLRSVGLGWEHSGLSPVELAARFERVAGARAGVGGRGDGEAGGFEPSDAEVGDLLVCLARLLAHRRLDAEGALRRGLDRLGERVQTLETAAAAEGLELAAWLERRALHEPHLPLC